MNRYSSYKDSGIEWLGEIPSSWITTKLKYKGDVIIGLSYKPDDVVMENEGTLVMRSSNVQNGKPSFIDNVYVKTKISEKLTTKEGDILICSRNGSRRLIGKNCLITKDIEGMSWGVFMTMYRSPHYQYMYWLLNSPIFKSQSGLFLTSTINQLTVSTLQNMIVPFTEDVNEQQQIVSFLDDKTQKIDSLLQQKEKKIELLKEKRTSLINHVVTKGLDPNVEMKYSGEEWVGEIPIGWNVSKFKYHSEIITGNTPSKTREDEFYTSDKNGLPWVKPSNLDKGFGYVTESVEYLTELGKNETRLVPKNSIMVCSIGNTLGKFGISGIELSTNQQINSVVTDEETLTTRYCMFFISVLTEDLIKWTNFVTLPIFTKTDFEDTEIIIPPLSEQQQIVEYLDKQTEEIETLIQLEQKKIDTLKEYRQSLISEVVTGKIKVV